MGALLSSLLLPPEDTRDLPFGCTLCGACKRACPLGIDHPKLMLALRQGICAGGPHLLGAAHSFLALHPLAYRLAVGAVRAVDPRLELLPRLPGLPGLTQFADSRQMPELKRPFSEQLRSRRAKGKSKKQGGA